jgi:hypothetical protein
MSPYGESTKVRPYTLSCTEHSMQHKYDTFNALRHESGQLLNDFLYELTSLLESIPITPNQPFRISRTYQPGLLASLLTFLNSISRIYQPSNISLLI